MVRYQSQLGQEVLIGLDSQVYGYLYINNLNISQH